MAVDFGLNKITMAAIASNLTTIVVYVLVGVGAGGDVLLVGQNEDKVRPSDLNCYHTKVAWKYLGHFAWLSTHAYHLPHFC